MTVMYCYRFKDHLTFFLGIFGEGLICQHPDSNRRELMEQHASLGSTNGVTLKMTVCVWDVSEAEFNKQ